MKKISHTPLVSFMIIITSNLIISPSLCDQQTQDLINQICRQTSDIAFCFDVLQKYHDSPNTNPLAGLTKLTTAASIFFAVETEMLIERSKAEEKNANVKQLYGHCKSEYRRVMEFLEGANYDANRGDYKSMETLLQSCSKPIILCQDGIGAVVPEMLEKNRKMRVLLSMGLYEGSLLNA